MEIADTDLTAIPVLRLVPRRLRLGPFGSGRDLVKFLGLATVGAMLAAFSSLVVWVAFLGAGAMVAFVRVRNQTLDDVAVDYCRFRWRSSGRSRRTRSALVARRGVPDRPSRAPARVRAGGIPTAYLPAAELERLFGEWRSTLGTLGRPVGLRVRGESFSPLAYLPAVLDTGDRERVALDSYRRMVRMMLRHRYHRVVELSVGGASAESGESAAAADAAVEELVGALRRLGIPALRAPIAGRPERPSAGGAS